ncbi:MAG: NAD-dependent malic enzyme, partial [Legionella sp. 21-45-4]
LTDSLEEMLPLIYTPTVGLACELFHRIYRQARGVFISYPEREQMQAVLARIAKTNTIRVIVVTDGERILGLGDQGVGGLGISIGKLSLYTACGGINPAQTLPIVLDVGTNNRERLNDPAYLGWRHARIEGEAYYAFVDSFVQAIKQYFPQVLLQFEDFAQAHAYPLLMQYRESLCTFNDDIQGTAAIVVACVLTATARTGVPLREQRVVVLGAGSAGCGISEQLVRLMMHQGLTEEEARRRFFLVDQQGLLQENSKNLLPFQRSFAHAVQPMDLLAVVKTVKPGILLGVSGQASLFTEELVKTMAAFCEHPIIFPLSNPTSHAEARPTDLLAWTDNRALIATGSPFPQTTQCNNAYIFPGLGLAVIASGIQRITDGLFMAAAIALSDWTLSHANETGARLLPPVTAMREISRVIANAVISEAIKEGLCPAMTDEAIHAAIDKSAWNPEYNSFVN